MTVLDAAGGLARARHHQLDPFGPRRDHFDRRRTSGAASASRTVCSSAGDSTGLCTYLNACSRTALSSVSGASSDVMTTTRGRCLGGTQLGEQIEAVHARHPDVEQQQIEAAAAERLERFDAVLRHRRRESRARQHLLQHVPRGLVIVDDEDPAHDGLRFRLAAGGAWRPDARLRPAPRSPAATSASSSRSISRCSRSRIRCASSKSAARAACSSGRGRLPSGRRADVAIAPFKPCAASRSASPSRCFERQIDAPQGARTVRAEELDDFLQQRRSPPVYSSAARSSKTRSVTCAVRCAAPAAAAPRRRIARPSQSARRRRSASTR